MKTLLLFFVCILISGCGDPNYSGQPNNNNAIKCTPGELVKDQNGNQGYCPNSGYIILSNNY